MQNTQNVTVQIRLYNLKNKHLQKQKQKLMHKWDVWVKAKKNSMPTTITKKLLPQ